VKSEYPEYFRIARRLLAVGGLLIADNVLGTGGWWIDDEANASRGAVDELNRTLAADPDFEAACVPLREGLLIARRER
jgi:predicted O-methyltransferase YrrM